MRCIWTRSDCLKVKEGFWFICMVISASAMDSENPEIMGVICIASAFFLLILSRRKDKKNDSV